MSNFLDFVYCMICLYSGELGGQRFFLGHNNDVSALAIHPDGETVASGQIGRDAKIIVWCVLSGTHLDIASVASLWLSPRAARIFGVVFFPAHHLL